jgi:hypothetical protein
MVLVSALASAASMRSSIIDTTSRIVFSANSSVIGISASAPKLHSELARGHDGT